MDTKIPKPTPEHDRVKHELTGPLVFQCLSCKIIVGDSFAWVAADRKLNSVTLYAKPHNIRVGTELLWSKEGVDIGSTYTLMYCNGCNATLGKVWRTTPRSLDYLRDLYTINLDSITIYALGAYIDVNTTPSDDHTLPSARMQQVSINKLQDMVLLLHQRISAMECSMGQQGLMTLDSNVVGSSYESLTHAHNGNP
ncbi:6148_t:CDS:2 [Acaulospora morrowiae]|uniref:6148_t:CDS:1 n=1 Tax=Acaulospora morrowiae TaxID=94023 RepID=A0A9N9CR01_9GLOM|nr:6148_t:CDS:2 [Acaulospora morrowiae]